MTITKGFWRTEDGVKAEVVDVRNGFAIGWVNDYAHTWSENGISIAMSLFNLTEPWIDKPEWDWSATPPWFNWLAMDSNDRWFLYADKPDINYKNWYAIKFIDIPPQYAPKWSGDWKDSLVGRPGVEVKP